MLDLQPEGTRIRLGKFASLSFHSSGGPTAAERGRPAAGGPALPLRRFGDYPHRVPSAWNRPNGFFLPVRPGEDLWLCFHGTPWRPVALKVGIGAEDAIVGGAWTPRLRSAPQDYLVIPEQPWLDGGEAGEGAVFQRFSAGAVRRALLSVPAGEEAEANCLRLIAYELKPGGLASRPPRYRVAAVADAQPVGAPAADGDPYGLGAWDQLNGTPLTVRLVSRTLFRAITGEDITAASRPLLTAAARDYPWEGSTPGASSLAG